jgi:hypothetical protein
LNEKLLCSYIRQESTDSHQLKSGSTVELGSYLKFLGVTTEATKKSSNAGDSIENGGKIHGL